MTQWSLPELFSALHDDVQQHLTAARKAFAHPVAKGNAHESVWLTLFDRYLPLRYKVASAFVVDSKGKFSEQLDIVIFDRQYTPFIFRFKGEMVVPAEAVYAVFETKQTCDAGNVAYAQQKIRSVRRLHRTSLPIPHVGGTYPAKRHVPILGGFLALDCAWRPPLGKSLYKALQKEMDMGRLDLGCIAANGFFSCADDARSYRCQTNGKPTTAFLFELIAQLQKCGTVPMIDIHAYASWLKP